MLSSVMKNFINKWNKEKNKDLFYEFSNYIKSKEINLYIFNNAILSYELNFKKITLNELFKLDEYKMKENFLK